MEKDVCRGIFYSGSFSLSVYGKLWGQLLPETIFLLSGSAGGEGEHGRSKGVVSGTGGENQRDSTGRAGGYGAFGPGKTGADGKGGHGEAGRRVSGTVRLLSGAQTGYGVLDPGSAAALWCVFSIYGGGQL